MKVELLRQDILNAVINYGQLVYGGDIDPIEDSAALNKIEELLKLIPESTIQ